MIGHIFEDLCNGCGTCADVCPSNVLEMVGGKGTIARQPDCQTCYMCELYCEADAIFVDPDATGPVLIDPDAIRAQGHLGTFRRDHGWGRWQGDPRYENRHWRMGGFFARALAEFDPLTAHVSTGETLPD